ncbi:MAG: hypothetical protein ABEK03_07890 [Candidatus Bipolaricaulia bacterium]
MIRRVFAVFSILVLLGFAAWAVDSYDTEWRQWQRAYYSELAKREDGNLSVSDRLKIESQISLNTTKIVTDSGRTADMCMSCHINQGVSGFEKPPLRNQNALHEEVFVLDEMPFGEVGCTACHGGESQALNSERAHTYMRDRYDEIFLKSVEELRSSDQMTRQEGIERIRWMTGKDFGFVFSDPVEQRKAAIERAMAWWRRHKDTFMIEDNGTRQSPFIPDNPQSKRIEELTHVTPRGKPLEFVGSRTCVSCHSNSNPNGAPYIPQSNVKHVKRWYKDAYKSSENRKTYLLNHPWLAEVLITQTVDDPERQNELIALAREARSTGEMPEPQKIDGIMSQMKSMDVTCEACHGPGSKYSRLMQKGLAMHYEGSTSSASNLLQRAGMIGRSNARKNVQNPQIWSLISELTQQAPNVQTPSRQMP